MKKLLFTIIAFLGFTLIAKAQEEEDKTQRQPTPITQAQVEKDERMAKEERKKHEKEKQAEAQKERQKAEDKNTTKDKTKKTSTHPGKQ